MRTDSWTDVAMNITIQICKSIRQCNYPYFQSYEVLYVIHLIHAMQYHLHYDWKHHPNTKRLCEQDEGEEAISI